MDRDLAVLYQVETGVLKQAVRRNITRVPQDFMFEMNKEEFANWRSQFVISNSDQMGLRYLPFCFTGQGVAILSSVLNSEKAINMLTSKSYVYSHASGKCLLTTLIYDWKSK
ncbi:ORF6N domain-containing protein [Daejeonella sp. H1SJ63]|uniref:ORF6N domain-containing protein n=1 Tax=Daejeonella sp. H1SJ63 TaxID=3034145 RepID=UPI0023EC1EC0|nr:ORF6N domain-containing protein [Daejeonella sp. H1SJ63]